MFAPLPDAALDRLFRQARTRNGWAPDPVPHDLLKQLWDLVKLGPTSANCLPARFLFCVSAEARERLARCALEGNAAKIRKAPCTVIVGMDLDFPRLLPRLFPHTDARSWFEGNDALIRETAFRNSSLQGGYLIMAARALGLDCGPMSGFDKAAVDAAFWAGTRVETNFLCSLGKGTEENLFPRSPRLDFDEACRIL
ncbi:MAG: malonic semialdehyde reductase [Sphingomonadaceae bacterium]|uniref:malonic semialdehyde reductase n=1 Tax=Thermaurantiacus sp. TaxID=2820283 RepID=UPI00298F0C41|nr:malonic semialdehyde reductase [Thermaurantiacus sp.]MCS6985922.1 malonic semialdehyde reductase [Sphingomonadaceae bacterium]MDW8414862.1 malonic semialdehyde reductase [Thermaurantiacus sp.]